jgi:glycosyltransferase involved in cell wall biosynthesis
VENKTDAHRLYVRRTVCGEPFKSQEPSPVKGVGAQRDQPTHVLFIIDRYMHANAGAERVLLKITQLLPAFGFRCSVVTFNDGDHGTTLPSDISAFRCPVHILALRRTWGVKSWQAATKLIRILREQDVRIVHTFFETSDIWAGTIARLAGAPVVVSSRRDMGILRSLKHKFAYKLISRYQDRVLTVSDQVRHFCISHDRVPENKVTTIYNGIDADYFCPAVDRAAVRRSLGLPLDKLIVTTVGNVRYIKGTDNFVRVAEKVKNALNDVIFINVGAANEPQYFAQVNQLAEQLGVQDRLRFVGRTSDVLPYLQASNVFALLSRSEGFSNALIEAMSCALPCVATRVGGNPEAIKDHVTGYIVNPEDIDDAARRILFLLARPLAAGEIGFSAREQVLARFTLNRMVNQLVSVYTELLTRTPAVRRKLT